MLRALGLPAEPGSIYELAVTHRSYAFERSGSSRDPGVKDNERLEFLGDAILGAVVTALIFRTYPELEEGGMSRLKHSVVSEQALAELARLLGLGPHIRVGRGEEASGGRDKSSLLANTLEAVIGAAYIDQGHEHVEAVLVPLFAERLLEAAATGGGYDAKTALQEVVVRSFGVRPRYRVEATGPDHAKSFTADVFIEESVYGSGAGRSKKEAETNAARRALQRVGQLTPVGGERDAGAC